MGSWGRRLLRGPEGRSLGWQSWADTGLSRQVRTNPSETLEADVQATLKRRNSLHRRKADLSPIYPFKTVTMFDCFADLADIRPKLSDVQYRFSQLAHGLFHLLRNAAFRRGLIFHMILVGHWFSSRRKLRESRQVGLHNPSGWTEGPHFLAHPTDIHSAFFRGFLVGIAAQVATLTCSNAPENALR